VYPWVSDTLLAISIIACSSSCVVILSSIRFKELRQRSFILVVWLAVADLGANASTLLSYVPKDSHVICKTQAILKQFFATAAVLWPLVIALTLYCCVVQRGIKNSREGCLEWFTRSGRRAHIFVWSASALFAVPPLATDSYGPAGAIPHPLYCSLWIGSTAPG
jgi:hypothetical protein